MLLPPWLDLGKSKGLVVFFNFWSKDKFGNLLNWKQLFCTNFQKLSLQFIHFVFFLFETKMIRNKSSRKEEKNDDVEEKEMTNEIVCKTLFLIDAWSEWGMIFLIRQQISMLCSILPDVKISKKMQ